MPAVALLGNSGYSVLVTSGGGAARRCAKMMVNSPVAARGCLRKIVAFMRDSLVHGEHVANGVSFSQHKKNRCINGARRHVSNWLHVSRDGPHCGAQVAMFALATRHASE